MLACIYIQSKPEFGKNLAQKLQILHFIHVSDHLESVCQNKIRYKMLKKIKKGALH